MKPDVVFSTFGYVNLALLGLRRYLPPQTRIIIREANLPSISLDRNRLGPVMRHAYRRFYPRADALVVTSTRMRGEFLQDFGLDAGRLHLIENPVDTGHIATARSPVQRHPGPGLRLVAAGRLTWQKGFDRLIGLVPELPADTHITILGDGPLRFDMVRQASELGVAERVGFAGFQKNPYPWFAGADAYLMPSRWEGMPNAALEALACGLPVIATPESGGIEDVREMASAGSVSVAEMGPPFLAATRDLETWKIGDLPRPSLLPPSFEAAHSAGKLIKLLCAVHSG